MNTLFQLNEIYLPQDKKNNPWIKELEQSCPPGELNETLRAWNYTREGVNPSQSLEAFIHQVLPETAWSVDNFSFAYDEFYLINHPYLLDYCKAKVQAIFHYTQVSPDLSDNEFLLFVECFIKTAKQYSNNSSMDLLPHYLDLCLGLAELEGEERMVLIVRQMKENSVEAKVA